MHRLEQESGIDLAELRLEDVADVAARIVEHVSAYPLAPRRQVIRGITWVIGLVEDAVRKGRRPA